MNFDYEQNLINQGHKIICGIDEAGRGPLAGPLVAAAVILDIDKLSLLDELKESKSLSAKKRDEFFPIVIEASLSWSVGVAHHFEIDKHGLSYANKIAMKRAWKYLSIKPDFIALDYMAGLRFETPFALIKSGDKNVISIAAASIIAKVMHDRMLDAFARKYPEYFFDQHKGYGTALHMEMIEKYGPCPIHRLTFAGVKPKLL